MLRFYSHDRCSLTQVCISGQMYKVAGQFLEENDILEIDLKSTPIQSQDYLEFFYYGGIW